MFDPEPAGAADFVVVESTYGDRVHELVDPAEALGEVVRRTIGRGGTLAHSRVRSRACAVTAVLPVAAA